MTLLFFILASLVTPLGNGEYQVPDNWNGCFVNPDDLNDTTFGCAGPAGDSINMPNASTIVLSLANGTNITFDINITGVYRK